MKFSLLTLVIVPMLWLSGPCAAAGATAGNISRKPNIIFILTDDQAPDTVASANLWGVDARMIRTPNMDKLAADGTRFSQAYNMGAWHGAVCVASRSMLNSGRFLWQAERGEREKFSGMIRNRKFWSQRMKAAGYRTCMAGKWHVKAPLDKLFDSVTCPLPGYLEPTGNQYLRPVEGKPDTWSPVDPANGGFWHDGKHWSERLADDAVGLIAGAAKDDAPFFLYLAFNAPHDPRQAPDEFIAMYPPARMAVPENFLPRNPHYANMNLGPEGAKAMRDESLAPFPRTTLAVRTHRAEYHACVSHLDAQIGRVLDALEQSGLAGNTHVILTSDQGLAVGRHGLMGKQNMYEHSVRVPFIIRGPGIPTGEVRDERIYMQDAMATVLDLAGANAADVDFHSLMPLLRHERGGPRHDAIYGAFTANGQRMVIDGNHKMILYPAARTVLLFDLAKDPLELRDLSGEADSTPLQRRLFTRLRALQKQTGDTLDLGKSYPDLME